MKKSVCFFSVWLLLLSLWLPTHSFAETKPAMVTHVVLVWLKQPGNKQMRTKFIAASKTLNNLPGIVHRHVGVVLPSERKLVDDTFDVAVTATFKNKKALQAYLDNPRHKKVIDKQLKPLTNRVVIYDFISQ